MELTLVKTKKYSLEPFGKFTVKFKCKRVDSVNIIPFWELRIDHETCMPLTDAQDKEVIKFMKANKTDILIDGNEFYTRAGEGFKRVWHKKFEMYRDDPTFKELVDRD